MIPRVLFAFVLAAAACGREPLPEARRFELVVPADRALTAFTISGDGQLVVYAAERDGVARLYVQSVGADGAPARELHATSGAAYPVVSPDGVSAAYYALGALWRVAADGSSAPQELAEVGPDFAGATWTRDNRIVYAPLGHSGLMAVPAAGGAPETLTRLDSSEGELAHGWPHAMPDGSLLFTVAQRGRDPHLEVLSPKLERRRLRVPIFGQAQLIAGGRIVYGYLGNLMTVRFDVEEGDIVGVPAVAATGLQVLQGFGTLGRSGFAVSRTGTLVWLRSAPEDVQSRLVSVRGGVAAALSAPAAVYQTPRLSPGGRHIAVAARAGVMTREIRVLDATRVDRIVATISGGDNHSPAWVDDRRLSFGSNRDGSQKIYVSDVEGRRSLRPLFTVEAGIARNPASWSRPPRVLAFYEIDPRHGRNVYAYLTGEAIVPVAATDANERSPAVSPDGRFVAYVSDVSGRDEVYVAPLRGDAGATRLTTMGAGEPVWKTPGLYYREGDRMTFRAFRGGSLGEPSTVFEGSFERDPGGNLPAYDVDATGRTFLMLKSASNPRSLRVVQNWPSELP